MAEHLTVRLGGKVAAVRLAGADGAAADPAGLQAAQQSLDAERARLAQARKALAAGLGDLSRLREETIAAAEAQLLELALEIARKVLMQEIDGGRYEIDPIVREALLHVPARQEVVVHLHPDDWAACEIAREAGGAAGAGHVRFLADPGVRRAECLLESPQGMVVSAVEAHLQDIAEALKEDSPDGRAHDAAPGAE